MSTTPAKLVLAYRIDAADCLTHVNEAWSEFARQNHGEELMPQHVLGHNLLRAIADTTVRELYTRMILAARAGRTLRFRYRCDAPARRRTFEMEIRLVEAGAVEFVSTLQHEEPRPSVYVLESDRRRDERMLLICSWCQKVELPDATWVPVEAAVEILHLFDADTYPQLTHGMCGLCKAGWHDSDL
jgi:hypothetical protein